MVKTSMVASTTNWSAVFLDSSVMFVTIVSLLLSLAIMGVPLLSSGFGITAGGSWHSVSVALVILIAAGYLFIQIISDVFDGQRRVLKSVSGTQSRWKPTLLTLAVLLLCAVLIYMKMRSGGGGYGGGFGGDGS
jgi:hypothetical protein